jgi:hypothetical protein
MEVKYSNEVPVSVERHGTRRTLNYNVRELGESELKELWDKELNKEDMSYEVFAREHKYSYNSLSIGNGRWGYSGIVEAIIRDRYSADQMEAITNNMAAINAVFMQTLVSGGIVEAIKFLRESADAADTETFREMQEWRAMAKREARDILKMY